MAQAAQGDAPAPERRGVVGVESQHGAEVAQRGLVCSQVDVGDPSGVVGEAVPPFDLDGGVEVPDRPVHPAHVAVGHAPVVVGVGEVGIQVYGPAQVLHRPVALAHRHLGQAPVVVGVGVAGGHGDGHVEVALHVLAFSLPGGSLVARTAALNGAGYTPCGPDSNRSPPAQARAGPSPRGLAFPRSPTGLPPTTPL